jgi:hypothetical protein
MAIVKIITLASLIYLAYLAVTCPCKRLWACHLKKAWAAVLVLVAVLIFENGLPGLHMFGGGGDGGSCSA